MIINYYYPHGNFPKMKVPQYHDRFNAKKIIHDLDDLG